MVTFDRAHGGEPIDTGSYKFSSEDFFADDASITGVVTGYVHCPLPNPPLPHLAADVALYVTGYTPLDYVENVGQVDSLACSQDGQELEIGFTDILPYETNGPDVVVFDGRGNPNDMLVAVRPVGDNFSELVLYTAADALPTNLPGCFPPDWAMGIDFERHGLVPGTVVDRIKLVADCNVSIWASEYNISMAAVVDHSCALDADCFDLNDCTTDFCGDDGFCKFDPQPTGTACEGGYCDGLAIPHCLACLGDADCAPPTPVCHPYDAQCVECVYDSDCSAQAPLCDWPSNTCVPCISGLQCDDGIECTLDTCDKVEGCHSQLKSKGTLCSSGICSGDPEAPACVECLENEDCPSERPYCRDPDGRCAECRYDNDCNDFVVCTEDVCASGSCFSYDDSGQCPVEGDGGAGGSSNASASSSGSGAGGAGDDPPPDEGCACSVGPRSSRNVPVWLVAAMALATGIRRRVGRLSARSSTG